MNKLQDFDALKIGLASTEKIRQWSWGEVKKPETINYRRLQPEKEGLFCEKIFGPTKDYECNCGKYKRIHYKGTVCEKCGVEVTKSSVRRERMGHIELAAPVSHIWYFKGIPSRMGLLLDMSPRTLERVLYFASYIVIDPGETDLHEKQVLSELEYQKIRQDYIDGVDFKAGMGAESVREVLMNIDLDAELNHLKEELEDATGQRKIRCLRRLEVVEAFLNSENLPEWMILDVLPVIPPDLRPMVQLDGGRFATSDMNDLYRRVINRNNRLSRLLDMGAPEIIVRNEKRMLQESVDALIDNGRRGRPVTGSGNRPLKSLSDMLKGKSGRFRQNLLGKRVDYSGRSVIVIGPHLKFNQCGIPKTMALELFKPFIMRELVKEGKAHNIRNAKKMVEREHPSVWDVLDDVIVDHPVLLNRAPTLHRLGIQAFEVVLVEGKAIKLHPLVCTAYNADFDGDQMAVHLPLTMEAQAEARLLMMSTNNILAPQDGRPITTPTQDMVLGVYYLTTKTEGAKGEGLVFKDILELKMAYEQGYVDLHAVVKMRVKKSSEDRGQIVESTVGRFILNDKIPQDIGLVDRSKNPYDLEVDYRLDKGGLSKVIEATFRTHGNMVTVELLDYLKKIGFEFATKSGITVSMADIHIPDSKPRIIADAYEQVDKQEALYRRGLISDDERYKKVIEIWTKATDDLTADLIDTMPDDDALAAMQRSGARGSISQIRQLSGMRGLMSNAEGVTVEIPITANFREGLSVQEFFISTHGSRKGLSDTALRTADSGYLTRRLVVVAQDVIVRKEDCGTDEYISTRAIVDEDGEVEESLVSRIVGRTAFEDILDLETGEIIVQKNQLIDEEIADRIDKQGIVEVKVRSVTGCKEILGVCSKCYGRNLATGDEVNIGEAVGIIAAQSIGEPGTQLTMRTFHTGGIAGTGITQGLPRIEELFEAREPKGLGYITEIAGRVTFEEDDKRFKIVILNNEDDTQRTYNIPYGSKILVEEGDYVEKGQALTEGSFNPHEILKVRGAEAVQEYITHEVQETYRNQGVTIADKHIEIIIRQMLTKVRVTKAGDSDYIEGSLVNIRALKEVNKRLRDEGLEEAEYERELLGITKASLSTESFLSAASFQETTRVLTDAAIKGRQDDLIGLNENVTLGKLIPAGTGMKQYNDIEISYEGMDTEELQESKTVLDLKKNVEE